MNKFKIISLIIGLLSVGPLMLNTTFMWDGISMEMAYYKQDPFFIEAFKTTQITKYYVWFFLNEFSLVTGINPKIFINLISILSVCGVAYEAFKLLKNRFRFDEQYAYLGAWSALAFPVWHSLTAGITFWSIFCVWLFMISVNLWQKQPLIAFFLFALSLQFFSIFAFAVGFAGAEFVLTVTKENGKQKFLKTTLFCFLLVCIFIPIYKFGHIHQASGTYNTFNAKRLADFFYFGLFALTILGLMFAGRKYISDDSEREHFTRCTLAFILLAFFSGLAYWAVGRPLRFFAFGSFTSRFTYLTCIPFAVGVAIIGHHFSRRWSKKTALTVGSILLVALIVLQHQGHSHKVAAVIFKEMLTSSFKVAGEPPSGYVSIYADNFQAPRHVQQHAVNMCLYKAFGKTAWMANGFWSRRGHEYSLEDLKLRYPAGGDRRKKMYSEDADQENFTKYKFSLDNYHQEGRVWYWYNFLFDDYSAFNPRLTQVEFKPE